MRKKALNKLASQIVPDLDCNQADPRAGTCDIVDTPVVNTVIGFASILHCYPIQSCYGHFFTTASDDGYMKNVKPVADIPDQFNLILYREAYFIWGLENSEQGKLLFEDLRRIGEIEPRYLQFGSSEAFWKAYPNSYVLQVEPESRKTDELHFVDRAEALHLEHTRDRMIQEVNMVLRKHKELSTI